MKSSTVLSAVALALLPGFDPIASVAAQPSSAPDTPCPWTATSRVSTDQIVANWEQLWAGDLDILDQVATPDIKIWQDRFSMGNTSVPFNIFNSTGLLGFVQGARQGYADYGFIHHFYFDAADGDAIVYRWELNATLGEMPGSSKPPGTHIAYNGTGKSVNIVVVM